MILELTEATGLFKPAEIEALDGILYDYFDHGHHFQNRTFVWDDAGRVLGYVYYANAEMADRTWYLYWIAVAKEAQGRGIGGRLLAHVEADIRKFNGRLLLVETSDTPHYEPTRRFYLKHGYTLTATIPDYYADGDGMVIFSKRLA